MCVCADLCRLNAEVSRQYLLSNVCSLEKAQKPSVSAVAAESLSDGRRSKLNAFVGQSRSVMLLSVSCVPLFG